MTFSFRVGGRSWSDFAARLDSNLKGIRFRVTARVAVRYSDSSRGTSRQVRRRDVAVARQLLRTHFKDLLGLLDPADTDAARDVLCAAELPQDGQSGYATLVRDISVDLDEAARHSLTEYDAGTRAVHQRQQSMAMRIAVVRDALADPVSSLAWLAGQEPGSIAPADLEACLTHLEGIAQKIKSIVPSPQPATTMDPITRLLIEYVGSIPHEIQRAAFLGGIAQLWRESGFEEYAQKAKELIYVREAME